MFRVLFQGHLVWNNWLEIRRQEWPLTGAAPRRQPKPAFSIFSPVHMADLEKGSKGSIPPVQPDFLSAPRMVARRRLVRI
jgi:hypothetical protein